MLKARLNYKAANARQEANTFVIACLATAAKGRADPQAL